MLLTWISAFGRLQTSGFGRFRPVANVRLDKEPKLAPVNFIIFRLSIVPVTDIQAPELSEPLRLPRYRPIRPETIA